MGLIQTKDNNPSSSGSAVNSDNGLNSNEVFDSSANDNSNSVNKVISNSSASANGANVASDSWRGIVGRGSSEGGCGGSSSSSSSEESGVYHQSVSGLAG